MDPRTFSVSERVLGRFFHVVAAAQLLSECGRVRFVGLQEAYNSSVLLLAATFELDNLEAGDFAKERHTSAEEMLLCKGYRRRAVLSDPIVCRAVMKANHLDVQLYEIMHRDFWCAYLFPAPRLASQAARRLHCSLTVRASPG